MSPRYLFVHLILAGLLVSVSGCGSNPYAYATKESLAVMTLLQEELKKVKEDMNNTAQRNVIGAMLDKLEEIDERREDLEPTDKEEREKILIKYAVPILKMRALLLAEAERVKKLESGNAIGNRIDVVIKKVTPKEEFFYENDLYKKYYGLPEPPTDTGSGPGDDPNVGGAGP